MHIGLNTVNMLDELGIGLNIDKLYTLACEAQLGYVLGCQVVDRETLQKISDLTETLVDQSELKSRKNDILNTFSPKLLSNNKIVDTRLSREKENRFNSSLSNNSNNSVVAYIKSVGIDIDLVYMGGNLVSADIYYNNMPVSVLSKVTDLVPNSVQDWSDINSVYIKGRLVIDKSASETYNKLELLNDAHAIVHYISTEDTLDLKQYIRFIATSLELMTQDKTDVWGGLDKLIKVGFEVPQRIRANGVTDSNYSIVYNKFISHFDNLYLSKSISYAYDGIEFKIDNQDFSKEKDTEFCVMPLNESKDTPWRFTEIEGIEWDNSLSGYRATIRIKPFKLGISAVVEKLENIDFNTIKQEDLRVGQSIKVKYLSDDNIIIKHIE